MQTVTVATASRQQTYSLLVGAELLPNLKGHIDFKPYSKVIVVTDEIVAKHWLSTLRQAVPVDIEAIILPSGEIHKTSDGLHAIWSHMLEKQCDRKSLVLTLGGGVIGDMGGFAAATYMRGVDCMHIPTTLLSQIDSSIGGKTAIDFSGIKNLVGTFTQPKAVIIDTQTLTTLPEREFLSGFGEIIKHGLIQDATYLRSVTRKTPREYTSVELAEIIAQSCKIKAEIVEADETEGGARKKLNFGHTVGHALESVSLRTNTPLLHGEAISVGMCIEADLSAQKGLLAGEQVTQITALLAAAGLPTKSPTLALDDVMQIMQSDKKNTHGRIRFTLLEDIGKAIWDQEVENDYITVALRRSMEKKV